MAEKTVVKNIRKALDLNFPGFFFKSHGGPYQIKGLPDIIGCHKGRFIGIEVKEPGKEDELTEVQQKRIDQINMAGGVAFMATSPEQVISKLREEFKNGKSKTRKPKRSGISKSSK